MNGVRHGNLSNVVIFSTPEGGQSVNDVTRISDLLIVDNMVIISGVTVTLRSAAFVGLCNKQNDEFRCTLTIIRAVFYTRRRAHFDGVLPAARTVNA